MNKVLPNDASSAYTPNEDGNQWWQELLDKSNIIGTNELKQYFMTGDMTSNSLWTNASTVLHIACQEQWKSKDGRHNCVYYVKLLVEHKASIYALNLNKSTPLMVAAEHGNYEVVKYLVDLARNNDDSEEADHCTFDQYLSLGNEYKQTAAMLAIERSHPTDDGPHLQILRFLSRCKLSAVLTDVNKYQKNGLIIACEFGKYLAAKFILLLFMNANVDRDRIEGGKHWLYLWTGSIWSMTTDKNKLQLFSGGLFERSVSEKDKVTIEAAVTTINALNANGNTPLMFACSGTSPSHVKIAAMMLELPGINIKHMSKFKQSAIYWAATYGNCVIMKHILKYYETQDGKLQETGSSSKNLLDAKTIKNTLERLCQYGHEKSLVLLLDYIGDSNLSPAEKSDIMRNGLVTAWKHGNVLVATLYFMLSDDEVNNLNEGYSRNLERKRSNDNQFGIKQLLNGAEQDEMYRRLSINYESIKVLFKMAALFDFHFEILENLLIKLDNPLLYVDSELMAFYSTLENGSIADYPELVSRYTRSTLHVAADPADASISTSRDWKLTRDQKQKFTYLCKHEKEELKLLGLTRGIVRYPEFLTDVDIVEKLLTLAKFFSIMKATRSMHRVNWGAHLVQAETMLLKCFSVVSLADFDTMQKFLDDHNYTRNSIIRDAYAFRDGPLKICVDHKLTKVFKSVHVISFINKLHWGFLCSYFSDIESDEGILSKYASKLMPTSHQYDGRVKNIVRLRSTLLYLRCSPASMFIVEGVSKFMLLIFVSLKATSLPSANEGIVRFAIFVWAVATFINEIGEMCENRFFPILTLKSLRLYFKSMWNRIDVISSWLVGVGVVFDYWNVGNPRAWYAIAAIFLSVNMLQYASANEHVGQLIFMIFAMMYDILQFAVIFIICIFGFCVAIYGLAVGEGNREFYTRSSAFLYLFNAAFANVEEFAATYAGYQYENYIISVIIGVIWVVFAAVILLNLVIARMSATYERIDSQAIEEWQHNRAQSVLNYLLLHERCPLSMVPPPLNILSTGVSILDYFNYYIWIPLTRSSDIKQDKQIKVLSISGTVIDIFMGIIMSFICPFLEYAKYIFKCMNSTEDVVLIEIVKTISMFPITYPMYVLSLLGTVLRIRVYVYWRQDKRFDERKAKDVYAVARSAAKLAGKTVAGVKPVATELPGGQPAVASAAAAVSAAKAAVAAAKVAVEAAETADAEATSGSGGRQAVKIASNAAKVSVAASKAADLAANASANVISAIAGVAAAEAVEKKAKEAELLPKEELVKSLSPGYVTAEKKEPTITSVEAANQILVARSKIRPAVSAAKTAEREAITAAEVAVKVTNKGLTGIKETSFMFSTPMNCFPIAFNETEVPTFSSNPDQSLSQKLGSNINAVQIKVIRVGGPGLGMHLEQKKDYRHLLVMHMKLQNMVCYTGQCFEEREYSWMFEDNLCDFPVASLKLGVDDNVDLKLTLIDRNDLNDAEDVVATLLIPSDRVKQWLASGRFEGALELDDGRGSVTITFHAASKLGVNVALTEKPVTASAIDEIQEFSECLNDGSMDTYGNDDFLDQPEEFDELTSSNPNIGEQSETTAKHSYSTSTSLYGSDKNTKPPLGRLQLFDEEERKNIFLSLRDVDEILVDLKGMLDGRLQNFEVMKEVAL